MTTRTFLTRRDTVMEALDDVEAFLEKIEKKKESFPNIMYEHEITIGPSNHPDFKWEIELRLMQYENNEID